MSYVWAAAVRPELMDMTSVADGRTHTITSTEFERGMSEALGRYRAVCGAEVVAASLAAQLGARCPQCSERVREGECIDATPGPLRRLARCVRGLWQMEQTLTSAQFALQPPR